MQEHMSAGKAECVASPAWRLAEQEKQMGCHNIWSI